MRLDKFICDCTGKTRTEVKKNIKQHRVSVNGEVMLKSDIKIDEYADKVYLDKAELIYRKYIYLMLNKPGGVVSATYDNKYKTVVDLLSEEYRHFEPFPVGRLDIDTEGLLILTNDGDLAHKLISPKYKVYKKYYAKLEKAFSDSYKKAFEEGVVIDGYKTLPAIFESISENEVYLSIYEGKFHQVKRMFEAVGNKVVFLKRISFGNVELDDTLLAGEMRELTASELKALGGKA